jgi:FtsP/CotA-like multicopper oxidase with cupredoxin domain
LWLRSTTCLEDRGNDSFFHYYPTGTSLTPAEYTDTIMQAQAQRGILESTFKFRGQFVFHAHKTEFAELGWNGSSDVRPGQG